MLVHYKVSATYFQLVKFCQFLSTLLLLSNLQLGILTSSVPSKLNNVKNLLRYCTIVSLMYCKTGTSNVSRGGVVRIVNKTVAHVSCNTFAL